MEKTKMTKILLPRGRKNEENFVIVSVNGRSFKIMKGVEVEVPDYVAEVLDNGRKMADEARRYVERMAD
jgi:predicted P-loop ATPase/GTPase